MPTKGDLQALAKTLGLELDFLGREYSARSATVGQMMRRVLVNGRVIALLSGLFRRAAVGAQQRSVLWMISRETIAANAL